VICRLASSSIQGSNGLPEQGTSAKTVPVHGGGTWAEPSLAFRRKTAICARVTGFAGQ
jgi:hypothetical protein